MSAYIEIRFSTSTTRELSPGRRYGRPGSPASRAVSLTSRPTDAMIRSHCVRAGRQRSGRDGARPDSPSPVWTAVRPRLEHELL